MNSIYIRSIGNDLKSYNYKEYKKCEECGKDSFYKIGKIITLNFCCISDANDYHRKYDIAASIHSIFALMWLREFNICEDIIFVITKLIYQVRKRNIPYHKCTQCFREGNSSYWIFINGNPLCSMHCRHLFQIQMVCYTKKQRRQLYIIHKSNEEINSKYIW